MTNNIEAQAYLRERNSKCGLSLSIVYRRIGELKPDPANPRRHSKQQIRKIADSIKAFGFNVPVLIDLIGGTASAPRSSRAQHRPGLPITA